MNRPDSAPTPAISAADGRELANELASALGGATPLPVVLRVAGLDRGGSLGRALVDLANRLESGESLEAALQRYGHRLPAPLRALVVVSASNGNMDEALHQWDAETRLLDELRQDIRSTFIGPLFVILSSLIAFSVASLAVGTLYEEMINMFGLRVEWYLRGAIWFGRYSGWVIVILLLTVLIVAACRLLLGRAQWNGIVSRLPLVGPVASWLAIARWSRWLSLLIESRIPLPTALELAASVAENTRFSFAARGLVDRIARGEPLSLAMAESPAFPSTSTVLVRWGEQSSTLAESLRSVAELSESRVRLRHRWVRLVLPLFASTSAVFTIVFVYAVLLGPMLYWLHRI